MDTSRVTEPAQDLPELTDAELAEVIGGNNKVNAAKAELYRRIGMCECGFAH
jgi:bacteriocin-like protein